MSNYSKITNFLSKDSLSLNDPAKYVKGSEIDGEYNAIAVAVATKADTESPTLVTPTLGVATATTINKITLTQPATGATLTILDGKTLTVNHTLTLAGTDGTTMTFPATSATLARIDAANTFVGTQTFSGLIAANLGLTVAGAAFNSRGITDNATAKALTLSGSGANSVTIANSATNPTIGTSAGYLGLTSGTALTDGLLYGWGATPTAWIAGTSAINVIGLYTSSAEQVRIASVPSATKRLGLYGGAAGNAGINVSSGSLELGSPVVFTSQTVGTTVGAAGGASALPATPLGYLTTDINGTACKIPYYTA